MEITKLSPYAFTLRRDTKPTPIDSSKPSEMAPSRAGIRKMRSESALLSPQILKGAAAVAPVSSSTTPVYPVVIIGAGISGLMAATYLGQAGLSPLVIEGPNPGGAIMQSNHVRNWPGIEDTTGAEIIENMHRQAANSGAKFEMAQIIDIDTSKRPYTLTTKDQLGNIQTIQANSIVISMGTTSKFLGVPGEQEYWTRGVYNCALCDGPLYKDKTVAVVGGANSAIVEALYLSNIAKKVVILMRGEELRSLDEAMKKELLSRPNVELRALTTVESIEGNGEEMTHVVVKSNGQLATLEMDALFLAIGSTPNTAIFKDKLTLDENGYLIASKTKETSTKGIFAIGDIVQNRCKQAVCAAGEAAEASLYVSDYLATLPAAPRLKKLGAALKAGPAVIEITSVAQFENELKNSKIPIAVDFYATWCGPCKAIAPVYEGLAKTHEGKVKFLKVNIDTLNALANKYQVKSIPTFLFFNQKGELVERMIGANGPKLKENVEKLLK